MAIILIIPVTSKKIKKMSVCSVISNKVTPFGVTVSLQGYCLFVLVVNLFSFAEAKIIALLLISKIFYMY